MLYSETSTQRRAAQGTGSAPPLRVAELDATRVLNALLHDEQVFVSSSGELPGVGEVSDMLVESRHLAEPLHVSVQIWGRRCAAGSRESRLPAGVYVRLPVDEHAAARSGVLLRALCMISTGFMSVGRSAELHAVFPSRASLHQALQRLATGETAFIKVEERVPPDRAVRVTATCEDGGGCTFVAQTVSFEEVMGQRRCGIAIALQGERARVARYVAARLSR